MSWLSDMFSGADNPADKAMPYLNNLPDELKPYFQKYMNYGDSAYNAMNPVLSEMTSDPTGYMDKLMASYVPSKSYQLQKDEMSKSAGNTAAAGGMRGSLGDITNEARITDTLMGNDMQSWLKNVMGIQDTGLQGEGHLFDTGFDASMGYANDLGNIRNSQAQLAYQGQAEKDASHNDWLSALIGGLGTVAGGIFGGPIGAAAGGALGGLFGPSGGSGPNPGHNFPDFNKPPNSGWM